MELIEVITAKVLAITYEIYEAAIDAIITAAYYYDSSEVEPDKARPKYWLLVKDPIRSHIVIINSKYDPDLL